LFGAEGGLAVVAAEAGLHHLTHLGQQLFRERRAKLGRGATISRCTTSLRNCS
jgi:hypothetical protein